MKRQSRFGYYGPLTCIAWISVYGVIALLASVYVWAH